MFYFTFRYIHTYGLKDSVLCSIFFSKRNSRVDIKGNKIFIDNQNGNIIGKVYERELFFSLTGSTPEINVYENKAPVRTFRNDSLLSNKNLAGQYLHSAIRVLSSSAVMIDGIISRSQKTFSKSTDADYEAVRFQPFFLSDRNDNNMRLIGKGLFERGLHFSNGDGMFKYYNSFKCPSCLTPFIDFERHKGIRAQEYYGNVYINEKPRQWI